MKLSKNLGWSINVDHSTSHPLFASELNPSECWGALQKDCACSSYGHTAQQTFRTTKPAQGKPSLNWGPNQAKQDRPAAKKNAKQLQEVQKLPCCHGSIRAPVTSRKRQRPLCEKLAPPFCQRSPLTLPDAGGFELLNYIWSCKVLKLLSCGSSGVLPKSVILRWLKWSGYFPEFCLTFNLAFYLTYFWRKFSHLFWHLFWHLF